MTTSTLPIDLPGTAPPVARIGPNAVTQLLAALQAGNQEALARQIFAAAGVAEWLENPPTGMVDERAVGRLHHAVRAAIPPEQATDLMTQAGRLTADYLLANRIPRFAQVILKCVPPWLAANLLVPAIRAHAWTFAGSGQFSGRAGSPTLFALTNNPLCAHERTSTTLCAWHAAVFERLFQVLVSPRCRVSETDCEARGDGCCRFVVNWRRKPSIAQVNSAPLRSRRWHAAADSVKTRDLEMR